MLYKSVVPSLSQLALSLYRFLANHPLFIHPLVFHPIDRVHVPVSSYRLMGGLPLNDGLTCSIFPAFTQVELIGGGAYPSVTSVNTSVVYKPYELGRNNEEAMYHFIIAFSYPEVSIDSLNTSNDTELITVPKEAVVHPNQLGLISNETTTTQLTINPPFDIISDYLELTRLALYDVVQHKYFPLNPDFPSQLNGLDIIHQNYATSKWSENTNAYYHQGHLLVRINAHVNMGWRDKFQEIIEEISISLEQGEDIVL